MYVCRCMYVCVQVYVCGDVMNFHLLLCCNQQLLHGLCEITMWDYYVGLLCGITMWDYHVGLLCEITITMNCKPHSHSLLQCRENNCV